MDGGSADGDGHRYFEDLAVAHVVGGLDESDGRVFRAHLLECSDCRARVWELRALAHELADVERDERRERAAQALETKEREEDEDGDASPPPGAGSRESRLPRALLLVGLAVILTLAAWNFTLRGTTARQGQVITDLQAAASVLEFGAQGEVIRTGDGTRGSVRVDEGRVALLVDGLVGGDAYGTYFLDAAGEVLHNRADLPTDGRLFLLLTLEPGTTRIVVTHLQSGPTSTPRGTRVFEGTVPQE